jgi:2-polyprenyl-3-methyl-5-hydroxy-6-metoxy-1,4-benzoquinol methylase
MSQPSPVLFFTTVNAYQHTAAIKTAIELEIFTTIGSGIETAPIIAQKCQANERGIRILCDYLTVLGFLIKQDESYKLTPDSAMFLDKQSPNYIAGTLEFMLSPIMTDSFNNLTASVRRGGTAVSQGTLEAEYPGWVNFARGMSTSMAMPAKAIAQLVNGEEVAPIKVLDISASHGLFGIAFAQRNPNANIFAVDWAPVLEVAKENATALNVRERFHTIAGSAFDVDFGSDYDIVLLPNFLHLFDIATCENLLKKINTALAPNGKVVTFEFILNEDRISPPDAAVFSLTMLAITPSGEAYTFAEYQSMFHNAGFSRSELHSLPSSPRQVLISYLQ